MRIGFIGLGNMGGSMALNLMKAGHTLIVHDIRRDRAFDGRVIGAVRTTGIYCKPSCPARRPKREHVEFFADAGAARASCSWTCSPWAERTSGACPRRWWSRTWRSSPSG